MVFQGRQFVSAAAAAALLLHFGGVAEAVPSEFLKNPGDEIREMTEPRPKADVDDQTPQPPPETKEKTFVVKKIDLDASELRLNQQDLAKILEGGMNREVTLSEFDGIVHQLTVYCRQHGYPASAAYLPAQTSTDGTVVIRIIPGRIGKVQLDNRSGMKDDVAMGFLKGLKPGDIIRTGKLETALYSISEKSGTKAVGVLAPGEGFGTSDVTVRIESGKTSNVTLYAENYGSKASGRYRFGLQYGQYDVGGTGARMNIGVMTSNRKLRNYYANYEMLVGRGGTTLGLGVSRMTYDLGGAFSALGATGTANTVSLFGSRPLFHLTDHQMKFVYGYDYRQLEDDLGFAGSYYQALLKNAFGNLDSEKHSHNLHVGIEGADRFPKAGIAITYDTKATMGWMSMDSDYSKFMNRYSDTEGRFMKLEANLTAVQSLGHMTDVVAKLSGQMANRNLDSSEEFYLGGARGVRAYPQAEASGDQGWLGSLELRYHTKLPGLTLSTYLDGGHVKLVKNSSAPDNSRSLKGWGIGVAYSKPDDWFARLDYARRIGNDGISADAQSKGRTWFILGKIW